LRSTHDSALLATMVSGRTIAGGSAWMLLTLVGCRPDVPNPAGYVDTEVGTTGLTDSGTTMVIEPATTSSGGVGATMGGTDDTGTTNGTSTSDGSSTSGDPSSTGDDPMCGDGVVEGDEQCDDAGESATCDDDCTNAICGDGLVNPTAGETCDDGNSGVSCLPGCTPCPDGVVFSEDFSDNSAGWTVGTEWAIGPAVASASPGACGNGDPGTDHSPTADNGVAGVVIGGNASTALHPFYYITSPPINAGGFANLELSLWRWLNSDYTRFMQNQIEVYNGVAWQVIWQSGPPPAVQDPAWTNVLYDVSAHANPNFQIRIGFNIDSGGVYTCSGWNVDDIELIGPACP
jgi:hypothetical protein